MEPRPVINIEDPVGKTVGRRKTVDPWTSFDRLQRTGFEIFHASGHRLPPKGVYRFASHEQANQWTRDMTRVKKTS